MTDSTPTADDADEMQQATAGAGEFLNETADKNDHEDWDEAKAAVASKDEEIDFEETLEEYPSATAGPGSFLAATAEHTGHHGDHSHSAE